MLTRTGHTTSPDLSGLAITPDVAARAVMMPIPAWWLTAVTDVTAAGAAGPESEPLEPPQSRQSRTALAAVSGEPPGPHGLADAPFVRRATMKTRQLGGIWKGHLLRGCEGQNGVKLLLGLAHQVLVSPYKEGAWARGRPLPIPWQGTPGERRAHLPRAAPPCRAPVSMDMAR